ncbi:MAG: hypothetical protein B7Z66_00810 [Chromatiales bacterium 21-64-14]|nr:MAG: hypothetical protein B7Z66_00810 [Chromatiales bacterium 21-64-14]HQU15572.1 transcription antitermination factor NusB [Gammaproteobacteria bacterium]
MAAGGSAGGSVYQARSWARRRVVQALYQWEMTGQDVSDIDAQFRVGQDMSRADLAYFEELLHQVPAHLDDLQARLAPFLDRPFAGLDPIERVILLIGGYELGYRLDVPCRVAINEAVALARIYGAEEGHKFVNGVLDRMAQQLRAVEMTGEE